MRLLLVLLCVAVGTVAAALEPVFAACLFLWHDIFQPLTFAYRYGEYPLALYAQGVLLVAFGYHAYRGRIHLRANHFVILTLVFLAWILVCTFLSPYPSAWSGFVMILKYLIPMMIISQFVKSKFDAEMLMLTLMFSVGIWAAAAGVLGPLHGSYPYLEIEGGQMTDNNEVAAATVGYLPFCIYFIFNYRWRFKVWGRLGFAAFLVISLSSIAFSQSRGAAVALGVLGILYLMLMSRRKIRDFTVMAVVVSLALFFAPKSFYERMETVQIGAQQTEESAQNRMLLMHAAWSGSLDHPIFGMGPYCWLDGYYEYTNDRHNPHNVWMKSSVETGFVGLALFLAVIGTVCFNLKRLSSAALAVGDKRASSIALSLMASIVGVCAALTFLSQPYWEFLWAIMAVGAGFYANYMAAYPKLRSLVQEKARARKTAG
ncbi:MAG: hypothetical protein JWO30_1021 [Fibrobacteres bacterium]|nr:hypothetical protein [Fibrobacterota bacterium]